MRRPLGMGSSGGSGETAPDDQAIRGSGKQAAGHAMPGPVFAHGAAYERNREPKPGWDRPSLAFLPIGGDVKERPILFSAPMVRAILDGRKTQTRRVVKPQPENDGSGGVVREADSWIWRGGKALRRVGYGDDYVHTDREAMCRAMESVSPYGVPGDRLWVRETWGCPEADHPRVPDGRKPQPGDRIVYAANEADAWQWRCGSGMPWRPSIHMPRWASRITLEVVSVRVERVQEIGEEDATAEGVAFTKYANASARFHFREIWDSINAARGFGWDANPWVWVVEFRRVAT